MTSSHPQRISIHALLAESDAKEAAKDRGKVEFLSTLSLRRATCISRCTVAGSCHFYPRSPCGERRPQNHQGALRYHFYPRSPCGERRAGKGPQDLIAKISIHALLAESDSAPAGKRAGRYYFYPRSPCGERLANMSIIYPIHGISIHALLAESDHRFCPIDRG